MYSEEKQLACSLQEGEINPQLLAELVQRVLHLIARRLNEQSDTKHNVLAVFTGTTAGFKEALSSLEQLMLRGTALRIILSDSAERIYGDRIEERLLAWPTASLSRGERWFCELEQAGAVVVPMLSVNTLSKVSALMADSVATNLILQALFMGKPVIAAIDGCEPSNVDRKKLSLDKGTPALQQALAGRLLRLSDFGCNLVKSRDLGQVSGRLLGKANQPACNQRGISSVPVAPPQAVVPGILDANLVDTVLVRRAIREKKNITIGSGGVITPLALELAQQQGLQITRN